MTTTSSDPLWFKNAIIYQTHVKAFSDASGDGVGDFSGLLQKLDYIESLGVTAIWLLPFYPSPLKDDGYDIANYHDVHSSFGTLNDFKRFLQAAHARGLKVITELVINHTSDQHKWFQRARLAKKGSPYRDFYVWSDTPNKYKEARIIFEDFETSNWAWDPVAKAYYWHRFYSHQPDLNFENPLVQKQIFKILDYWFEMGVDGLRLDAIPYLFQKEGTNCENLPETHTFLKKLRAHVDTKFQDKVFIAEANQWPEDAAKYFGDDDECHMAFHFPIMPRLFMAIEMEDRFSIIDILDQTPAISENCQWVIFLRNHDELTLEMVSDKERDYMYRIFAKDPKSRINVGIRRRLAPLLHNNRQKIELMMVLLFSLPGTPVLYYGDEIGMGDNYYLGDRNGVRTPMQWSSDRNAGFSNSNPQQLYLPLVIDPQYHYEVVNVENHEQNPTSLLWWVRRMLSARKNYKAFGMGSIEFLQVENSKILAYIRKYEDEVILVIVNLSRFAQSSSIDLSEYKDYRPRELFHNNRFPLIEESPYTITMGPYGYFLLSLIPSSKMVSKIAESERPTLITEHKWQDIFTKRAKTTLEKEVLEPFLQKARWFERKSYTIQNIAISETFQVGKSVLCFVDVSYLEIEDAERYFLPLSFCSGQDATTLSNDFPQAILANVIVGTKEGILYDSMYDSQFHESLFQKITRSTHAKINGSQLICSSRKGFRKEVDSIEKEALAPKALQKEQSNSSVVYGSNYILKMYRRIEDGVNPDVEIQRYLYENTSFSNIAPVAGTIDLKQKNKEPITVGFMQDFVAHEENAWQYTQDALQRYFETVLSLKDRDQVLKAHLEDDRSIHEHIEVRFLDAIELLAKRTAEMHTALSKKTTNSSFSPEPFSWLYQRSLYQEMRSSSRILLRQIRSLKRDMPEELEKEIESISSSERAILDVYKHIAEKPFEAMRMRIHGDYHLGQILYTGKDFVIIDFEGEPLHSLAYRKNKRSPLQDVAGLIRSFHYAALKALYFNGSTTKESQAILEPWAALWFNAIKSLFVESYYKEFDEKSALFPKEPEMREKLLNALILEKAIYELGYELNMRPEWAFIPCKGINAIIKA